VIKRVAVIIIIITTTMFMVLSSMQLLYNTAYNRVPEKRLGVLEKLQNFFNKDSAWLIWVAE